LTTRVAYHAYAEEAPPHVIYVKAGLVRRVLKTTRELSFEAADRFAAALSLALLAREIGARWRVDARLGDRDSV
jgi:hypothetical protein